MFYGEFSNKRDVCGAFNIPDFDGVVIYASYETPSYDGYADVVFVHNGKFYTVSGSHCSCYGLEDQWEPEEMPLSALQKIAEEGNGHYSDAVRSALEAVERLNLAGKEPEFIEMMIKMAFD